MAFLQVLRAGIDTVAPKMRLRVRGRTQTATETELRPAPDQIATRFRTAHWQAVPRGVTGQGLDARTSAAPALALQRHNRARDLNPLAGPSRVIKPRHETTRRPYHFKGKQIVGWS